MKKIVKFVTVAVIASASLSANAWWGWGPYGHPGWGYAPAYAVPAYGYAPVVPGYAPLAPWGVAPYGANPFVADPFGTNTEDFFKAPEMPARFRESMEQSTAEREQARKLSEARMAAAQQKANADKAAMDERRKAWREATAKRIPYDMGTPFSAPAPGPAEATTEAPKAE